jgi:hypothetical protein
MALVASDREGVVITCWFMALPWAIKTTATGEGTAGWRRSRILSPPRNAAKEAQWKTAVNGNNYSSGRALDNESVDNNDNGSGGGGPASMIDDEDNQAGVATGGDDKGNLLRSCPICNDGIGRGVGIKHSIHSEW